MKNCGPLLQERSPLWRFIAYSLCSSIGNNYRLDDFPTIFSIDVTEIVVCLFLARKSKLRLEVSLKHQSVGILFRGKMDISNKETP